MQRVKTVGRKCTQGEQIVSRIHFLNVKEGDCSIVEHSSGRVTVIDVSNAYAIDTTTNYALDESVWRNQKGNYHQKEHPVNPIQYMDAHGITAIFRFILTHPDMDHMDGIKDLFESFDVTNFWDTENNKVIGEGESWGTYNWEDWDYYQNIRDSESNPKTVHFYAGSRGVYYNEDENDQGEGDGLYILTPTTELRDKANESKHYNDISYVLLHQTEYGQKVIFAGDSEANTWDYILENHKAEVSDIDVLIAPHHGRQSGGNKEYLDVLNPKLTLLGNAESESLDYNAWNRRGLYHITNNQAGCVMLEVTDCGIEIYVTNKKFAQNENPNTWYNSKIQGWFLKTLF